MLRLLLVLWIPLFVAACQPGAGESVVDLAGGWNRIEPGGETTCSDGSPYASQTRTRQLTRSREAWRAALVEHFRSVKD